MQVGFVPGWRDRECWAALAQQMEHQPSLDGSRAQLTSSLSRCQFILASRGNTPWFDFPCNLSPLQNICMHYTPFQMFKINAVANSSRFCLSLIIFFFVSTEMRADKNRAGDGLAVPGSLLHHQLLHRLLKAAIRQDCLSHIYELMNPPVPFVIPSPGRH